MARILVMESNDALRELLTQGLLDEGYEVEPVSQPAEDVTILTRHGCDLILTGLVAQTFSPKVLSTVKALTQAALATPAVQPPTFRKYPGWTPPP